MSGNPTAASRAGMTSVACVPTCLAAAVLAVRDATRRQVSAVDGAVASDAERDSVRYVETQGRGFRPRCDVVGMEERLLAAPLTGELVAGIDGFPPDCELRRQPRSFALHRLAIFPGIASSSATSAGAGTETLPQSAVNCEYVAADGAGRWFRRIANGPASFRAVVRSALDPRRRDSEGYTAHTAAAIYSLVSTHVPSIIPHYCQVALDRWQQFTGQTATKVSA